MANKIFAFPVSAGIEISGLAPGATVALSVVEDQLPPSPHYIGTIDDSVQIEGDVDGIDQLTPAAIIGSTVVNATITPYVGTYTAGATTTHFLSYVDATDEEVVFAEDFITYQIPLALWQATSSIRLGVTVTLGGLTETFYSSVNAVTISAPTVIAAIPAQIYDEDDGDQTINAASYVQVLGDPSLVSVTWSVAGTEATIDSATGVVTLGTVDSRFGPVTVTATNAGGPALIVFDVTVLEADAPAPADQTIYFGALTPTGEGDAQARDADGAAINITSIDSQPAARWALSSGKLVYTGTGGMLSEQITATVDSESVTINVVVVPRMVSCSTATEFTNVSMTPAGTGDFTIQLRAGVTVTMVQFNAKVCGVSGTPRVIAGTLTVTGEMAEGLPAARVEGVGSLWMTGGTFVLSNLLTEIAAGRSETVDGSTVVLTLDRAPTTDVILDGIVNVGNATTLSGWPGVTAGGGGANDYGVDTWGSLLRVNSVTGTFREYAYGAPDIVTVRGIPRVLLGIRLISGSTYEMQISDTSGTDHGIGNGTVTAANENTNGTIPIGASVVGLDGATATVLASPAGVTAAGGFLSGAASYTYQVRGPRWLGSANATGALAGNMMRNLTIRNCDVGGVRSVLHCTAINRVIIEQNRFHHFSQDFIKIRNKTGQNFELIIRRNDFYSSMSSADDLGGDHTDYIQIFGDSGGFWPNFRMHHNRILCNARGDGQGMFNGNGTNSLSVGQLFGNIIILSGGGNGISQVLGSNSQVCHNTLILNQKIIGLPADWNSGNLQKGSQFNITNLAGAVNTYSGWNACRFFSSASVITEKNFGTGGNTAKTQLEMVAGLGGGRPLFFQDFDDMMEGCATILTGADSKAGALGSNSDWSLYPYRVTTDDAHLPFTLDYEPGTAPAETPFTLTSPDAVGTSGATFQGTVTVNIAGGTGYWALVPLGATAPDADEIIAGTDGDANPAFSSGTFSVATAGVKTILGAASVGDWLCYMVQRSGPDTTPVVDSGAFSIAALTIASPTAVAVGSTGWAGTISVASEAGTVYWVRYPSSATNPNATQIVAGTDGDDVAATASGNATATAGTMNFSGAAATGTWEVAYAQKDGGTLSNAAISAAFAVSDSGATMPVELFTPVVATGNNTTTTESPEFTPVTGGTLAFALAASNHTTTTAELVRTVTIGAPGRGAGQGTVLTYLAGGWFSRSNSAIYTYAPSSTGPLTLRVEWTSSKRACTLYGWYLPNTDGTGAVVNRSLSGGSTLTNTLTTTAANSLVLHLGATTLDTAMTVTGVTQLATSLAGSGSNVITSCVGWETKAIVSNSVASFAWGGATGNRSGGSVEFFASAPAAPANVILPAITGTGLTAASHTVSTGTWSGTPTSYAYQWKLNGSNVGTNANAYTPVSAGSLTCVVTATNAVGSTSATSGAVTITAVAVPVNSVLPVISGTGVTGASHTVTTGTWSNTPTAYAYQWKLGGGNVGTNASAYTPVSAGTLTCVVTASNAGGAGSPATAAGVTINAPAAFEPVFVTSYSDSTTGSTVVETPSFTPLAGQPLIIVVHGLNDSSTTRQLALKVTIGAPSHNHTSTTAQTEAVGGNNARNTGAIFFIEAGDVVATLSTVKVGFNDGVNADSKRAVDVSIWRVPGAHATAALGNVGELGSGAAQSLAPAVTTGTNNSIVFYSTGVTQPATSVTVAVAGATQLRNAATGTTNASDFVAVEAWETTTTAGAYSATLTWTGSTPRFGVGVEVKPDTGGTGIGYMVIGSTFEVA